MSNRKYSKLQLEVAVAKSFSFANVLRELGIPQAGGSQSHIKRMILADEIDVSHFTGQAWSRGAISRKRRLAVEVLTLATPNTPKVKTIQLRRSLLEIGREEVCSECGVGSEYNGKPLTLEIDHISGESWDNRPENLRFLCPNCHSQQATNRPWKRNIAG